MFCAVSPSYKPRDLGKNLDSSATRRAVPLGVPGRLHGSRGRPVPRRASRTLAQAAALSRMQFGRACRRAG